MFLSSLLTILALCAVYGLAAIPAGERQTMPLKAAMLRILQKKYPCRR